MSFFTKSLIWLTALAILFIFSGLTPYVTFDLALFILLGVSFTCELIDSSLGMGYGTILTPTLLLLGFDPEDVIPTILLSELFTGFSAAYFHNEIKNVDFSLRGQHLTAALILIVGCTIGVLTGVYFSLSLMQSTLLFFIGLIIFVSGLLVVIFSRTTINYANWKMILLSILAAFNKSVSGGGFGPIITSGQVLSGVEGKSAVGITALAEGFVCFLALALFQYSGKEINYLLLVPVMVGALLSIPFSVTVVNSYKEHHLRLTIGIMTMILGSLTLLSSF